MSGKYVQGENVRIRDPISRVGISAHRTLRICRYAAKHALIIAATCSHGRTYQHPSRVEDRDAHSKKLRHVAYTESTS